MESLIELIKRIDAFIPGDLVEGIDIEEIFKIVLNDPSIAPENIDMIKTLAGEFSGIIQQSSGGDEEIIKVGIVKGLNKLVSFTTESQALDVRSSYEQEEEVEDLDVLASFIVEAHEHLENIEEKILGLETGVSPEMVNEIFRSMHTIKGVSSFLGLKRIKTISHHMESVLDDVRKEQLGVSPEMIDILLAGVDLVVKLVNDLSVKCEYRKLGGTEKVIEASLEIDSFIKNLESISKQTVPDKKKETAVISKTEELFTPEMLEKFVAESSDLLDSAESAILDVEDSKSPLPLIDEAFRSIHTIKGNAGFFWFGYIEKLCMDVESVLDVMRKDKQAIRHTVISSLLSALDELRFGLKRIQDGKVKPGEGGGDTPEEYRDDRLDKGDAKPLGDLLVEMGAASRLDIEQALEKQSMRLGELLVHEGVTDEASVEQALKKQGRQGESAPEVSSGYGFKRKDIRVDTSRLDRLFDLMGELITAETMVLHNPDIASLDLPEFQKASAYLSKITREMQEITMSIRMIPLEGLFNKMRRLVRDLSRKFGKEVILHISGEQTEMDRNVMEEISDPLVHIIRNSIDHGIESEQVRKAAGKPVNGNVYLDARYEGNEIWISIQDDGGGLKKERILEKSRERGIVGPEATLSDQEIYQLIFEPGFSTAQQVSEISGRGVGMDVVRQNLDKLRGKIDIRSEEGSGTEFILRIPLTLAIIDGITARVGNMLYSLPVTDVTSFQKADMSQVTSTDKQREVFRLRDTLLPIVRLADFFCISNGVDSIDEGILIISEAGRRGVAMLVDEIIGYRQMVVKALPEYMGSMRAISGCSIMGEGEVSLILDIGAMVNEELD